MRRAENIGHQMTNWRLSSCVWLSFFRSNLSKKNEWKIGSTIKQTNRSCTLVSARSRRPRQPSWPSCPRHCWVWVNPSSCRCARTNRSTCRRVSLRRTHRTLLRAILTSSFCRGPRKNSFSITQPRRFSSATAVGTARWKVWLRGCQSWRGPCFRIKNRTVSGWFRRVMRCWLRARVWRPEEWYRLRR